MMRSLIVPWVLCALQASATLRAGDVSALRIETPVLVADLDLGKLKGDLRQVGWSPDGKQLYVQTVEGNPASPKRRHYLFAVSGGALAGADAQPEWAADYWAYKSDRLAPGLESVAIDVEQKIENLKFGTGSPGAADRSSNPMGAENINSASNVEKAAESQHVNVVRLKVYGETISEFQNVQPIPGLTFSWGEEGTGAIAYTDEIGRLFLLDRQKHKRTVAGVKDALLPAWTNDGTQLAWVQKTGRKKYALMYANVRQ